VTLAAEPSGKYKMVMQVTAILLLIVDGAVPPQLNFQLWGTLLLLLSMIFSLVSAWQYSRQFAHQVLPRWGVGNP
jgi:phosphatidylglycerophosphate synthase